MSGDGLPDRLRTWALLDKIEAGPVLARDLRKAADVIVRLRAGGDVERQMIHNAANEIKQLQVELERTRQAWVDGDDPMCDDVCLIECKGPCCVNGAEP